MFTRFYIHAKSAVSVIKRVNPGCIYLLLKGTLGNGESELFYNKSFKKNQQSCPSAGSIY